MFQSFDELNNFYESLRTNDYQRENFDKFLRKVKFKFEIPSIHIAGTNGKGSVGTILNNIYLAQGYKVGYYQSPYFIDPSETIKVNNKGIDITYFDKIITKYIKEIKKYSLSMFEIETFVAFNYFLENECDICVIECGMGGEIDATNIFTPVGAIITSISLEHTDFLGSSISEIASEKAGIIKQDIPVVCGELDNEAMLVLAGVCRDFDAKLIKYDNFYQEKLTDKGYMFTWGNYENLLINSHAFYSLKNAAIALTMIKTLNQTFPVDEKAIKEGLIKFNLIGRLTKINDKPLILLDGAHNPEAMKALFDSMSKLGYENIHIVFASFKDKNVDTMISDITVLSRDLTLTTFPHHRARNEEHYFLYLQDYKYEQDCFKAINNYVEKYPDDVILVCGSLAFVGYIYNHQDQIKKGDK